MRIHRQFRLWQVAGQDPNDAFRGLYVSDAEAAELLARPLGSNWGYAGILPPDEFQVFAQAEEQAAHQVELLAQQFSQAEQTPPLLHLMATFGLDRFELDAFLICLAPTLDLRYERLYGYLQDDVTRKHPTVNLVLDLLCEPGLQRLLALEHFADHAPLIKYRLIERVSESGAGKTSLLSQILLPDDAIVAWLLGRYEPHADLAAYATLSRSQESETDELLAGGVVGELTDIKPSSESVYPVVAFCGQDRTAQEAAARLCTAWMDRPLLTVNLSDALASGLDAAYVVHLALRDARLTCAIPFLWGWDAIEARDDYALLHAVLVELYTFSDLVIVASQNAWQSTGIDRQRPLFWFEFDIPNYAQRAALWAHYLYPTEIEQDNLEALAGQFALSSGQIRDAVASARDIAVRQQRSLQVHDLFVSARMHSNPKLSSLARKIEPHYGWADIVLPDDQLTLLHEIVDTVRGRAVVLDEWGLRRKLVSNAGITVLFAGPPGTGKTMAAEVIAAELGLDLYKIDLSTVVSKYIGETEKNLEKIFNEAQSSNAILFFDEADALFGKRSEVKDAHDRYANIEISYLLQRMEIYNGITILATNLRANLDEAFTRRLQFSVDFPFPEEEYRLRIWQTLFPSNVPCSPDVDFDLLARRFKLAGGNIRNIIVSAAYLAAADGRIIMMTHLLHGTRRELQKIGRLVNEKDMTFVPS
ncbi:MAG: ATP-binding protein [Anaerolineae bacterium]|nr:ATP-binding protein [Anaerolineae bacterium]